MTPHSESAMSEDMLTVEAQNTDRELWRGPDDGRGDFYADSVFVTESGGIGINMSTLQEARAALASEGK